MTMHLLIHPIGQRHFIGLRNRVVLGDYRTSKMPPKNAKQPKSKQKVQEEKREEPLQAVASKTCISLSDRS